MFRIRFLTPISLIVTLVILYSYSVNAEFYSYAKRIYITDSDGLSMGYVTPYQKEVLSKDYAYLKWKRAGFPEGNSFPIALIEGTTTALPFGIQGELLRVKINSISDSGVDLTINKSDVLTGIQNISESLSENVEAIGNETGKPFENVRKGVNINEDLQDSNKKINKFTNQSNQRIDKFTNRGHQSPLHGLDSRPNFEGKINKVVNRGYHSSLHILNSKPNVVEKRVDILIKNKESEFAEKIADRIIPLLIGTFVAGASPITSITYSIIINQIPSSLRHNITKFVYNIGTKSENNYSSDSMLSRSGVTTIFIGNPNRNKFSSNLSNELKKLNLPYFSNGKIIGKKTYSEDSIGLIAAIPEEKVWSANTIQNRWNQDKIRLYKTMIAGVSDPGLKAATVWYNDQLDIARKSITSVVSLTDGADSSDILKIVSDDFNNNPKSTISSAALMQGWILIGLSSLQSSEFDKVESLGYVAIVKKKGSSYDVLEIHTINGYKIDHFLNPY